VLTSEFITTKKYKEHTKIHETVILRLINCPSFMTRTVHLSDIHYDCAHQKHGTHTAALYTDEHAPKIT